jgi:hypothetical protein
MARLWSITWKWELVGGFLLKNSRLVGFPFPDSAEYLFTFNHLRVSKMLNWRTNCMHLLNALVYGVSILHLYKICVYLCQVSYLYLKCFVITVIEDGYIYVHLVFITHFFLIEDMWICFRPWKGLGNCFHFPCNIGYLWFYVIHGYFYLVLWDE